MKKRKRAEDGYALVENILVLPVVFLVLFALIFAGCMLHAQCTIDSAARRGARYAAKLICDPQYKKIVAPASDEGAGDLTDLASKTFDFTGIEHYEPYRYIPLLSSYFSGSGGSEIEKAGQAYAEKIIKQNTTWMFAIDTDSIVCDAKNYLISQSVDIKITAVYHMPKVFRLLGLPEEFKLAAEDKITVSDQDEFIRNVDFADDLMTRFGLKEKLAEPLSKLMNYAKKLFK